jgi:hypothetical protein
MHLFIAKANSIKTTNQPTGKLKIHIFNQYVYIKLAACSSRKKYFFGGALGSRL